ncbi:hypothetical protein LCGC14_1003160 [marine sediment metagenome]|uniref:HNH nuclease domain-containing protein n=1 Tax=marine sediment metagenome TaxID=412755 RepID=A0A0F9QKZ6_9ZZZZ
MCPLWPPLATTREGQAYHLPQVQESLLGQGTERPVTELKWFSDSGGYLSATVNGVRVRQHRWVMEKHLRRKLERREIVHHVNHDGHDNRIENLEVMTQSEHIRLHTVGKSRSEETKKKLTEMMRQRHTDGLYAKNKGRPLNISDEERRLRSERNRARFTGKRRVKRNGVYVWLL